MSAVEMKKMTAIAARLIAAGRAPSAAVRDVCAAYGIPSPVGRRLFAAVSGG